jgi:hypothetical protein
MDLPAIVAAAAETRLDGTVLRLVQQQGIDSLAPLVDNLDQLARLETLVEASKPPAPEEQRQDTPRHLLLVSPFRYPPLRHGSRFGSRQERGLFYGSRCRQGALVEGAYYGLLFWEGMVKPPPGPIRRRQTLFSVLIGSKRGRMLQELYDPAVQAALGHPSHYGPTQRLGSWMREGGVEAFEYLSARSRQPLVQVGVFSPSALRSTPFDQLDLTAEIRSDQATFLSHDDGLVHAFPRQEFLVDGMLPQAAV